MTKQDIINYMKSYNGTRIIIKYRTKPGGRKWSIKNGVISFIGENFIGIRDNKKTHPLKYNQIIDISNEKGHPLEKFVKLCKSL